MTQAGAAQPAIGTTGAALAGPALRVAVVNDGRPVLAGPAMQVVVVSDGRPTQGNEPLPIVYATGSQVSQLVAGPPVPVVMVSGSLYAEKVRTIRSGNLIAYWPLWETSGTVAEDYSGNSRNGTYVGATLGQTGIGDGRTVPLLDGIDDYINVYSASLAAAFNGAEGTIAIWMRVGASSVWTDATNRRILNFMVDGNNRAFFLKNTTSNQFEMTYIAGGTSKQKIITTNSPNWLHLTLTWSKSNDRVIGYFNGAPQGATLTGLGTWAGALSSTNCVLGATSTTPTNPFFGYEGHAAIWSAELTASEVAQLARAA